MTDNKKALEESPEMSVHIAKAKAVREAMVEILVKHQPEVIALAKVKLNGLGIAVTDEELGKQL